MSAEIDSSCQSCGYDPCEFSTKIIKGHSKRHRTFKCPKCNDEGVTGFCSGC